MDRISFVALRPQPGKDEELKRVMASRLPLLHRLGLSTDRTNITMRAAESTSFDFFSVATLFGAAIFPVIGATARTIRLANECGRNANRFKIIDSQLRSI